jgi:hypothetical protein
VHHYTQLHSILNALENEDIIVALLILSTAKFMPDPIKCMNYNEPFPFHIIVLNKIYGVFPKR